MNDTCFHMRTQWSLMTVHRLHLCDQSVQGLAGAGFVLVQISLIWAAVLDIPWVASSQYAPTKEPKTRLQLFRLEGHTDMITPFA